MFYDVAMNFVIGTILMVAGAIMIWIPNRYFYRDLNRNHRIFMCQWRSFNYSLCKK